MRVAIIGVLATLLIGLNTASAGLVVNGGFETGDFSGWTLSGAGTLNVDYGITAVVPHSGSFAAWFGDPNGLTFISQVIPTAPGQQYQLGLWASVSNQGSPPQNEVQFFWNGVLENDSVNVSSLPWTFAGGTFTATQTTTAIQFGFYNVPGWFNLDDVSVDAVPEPGTMVLYGAALGVLAMFGQCGRSRIRNVFLPPRV